MCQWIDVSYPVVSWHECGQQGTLHVVVYYNRCACVEAIRKSGAALLDWLWGLRVAFGLPHKAVP